MWQPDEFYMQRALELAAEAEGQTSPNPMVGCVITDEDGEIVAEGYHHKAGEGHAEVEALAALRKAHAVGHTAYVSLEPCCYYGRTGPCCDALIHAGIRRVVAAMEDPNPKVAGEGFHRLREAGVEVHVGVCEAEAHRLNEKFLTWVTQRRPFISLKYAMTLDGKIATAWRDSHMVSGEASHEYSHYLRATHDAILVGIGTVFDDDCQLTTRLVPGKNPLRVVLDARARIPFNAQVLAGGAPTLVVVGEEALPEKVAALREMPGVDVLPLPNIDGKLDLVSLVNYLGAQDVTSLLVEGGSAVHGSFLAHGLVDRLYAFISPKLVGGEKALTPIGGEGLSLMDDAYQDLLLSGRVTPAPPHRTKIWDD